MAYNQAQSPRLGQKTPVETTYVQIFDVDPETPTADLIEAAWPGMLIFRLDTSQLYIYNADAGAWQDVAGGIAGHLTFVGPEPPVAHDIGDTWFDDNDAYKQYVWTGDPPEGTGWVVVTGAGGSKTHVGPTPPVAAPATGDAWVSSLDWQHYVWDGTGWKYIKVPKAELDSGHSLGLAKAVEKLVPPGTDALIAVYYRDTTPTGGTSNDLWSRTSDAALFRYDGSNWNQLIDATVVIPISLAGEPRAITDEQISLYYQATAPSGLDDADTGDLWTDSTGLIKVWSGVDWLPLQATADDIAPGAVNTVHIADHAIKTPQLADFAVGTFQISDFAIPVKKLASTTHMIY